MIAYDCVCVTFSSQDLGDERTGEMSERQGGAESRFRTKARPSFHAERVRRAKCDVALKFGAAAARGGHGPEGANVGIRSARDCTAADTVD